MEMPTRKSETLDEIDAFAMEKLKGLLSQLPDNQQEFFKKVYPPNGIDSITKDKIPWAIRQCEATIRGNKKKELEGK